MAVTGTTSDVTRETFPITPFHPLQGSPTCLA